MEPAVFLGQLYEGARETFHLYGIFPSVTAAQAILESDWGRSQLARECCNLFGIKADSGWKGEKKAYLTKEYDRHGQLYTVTAYFRKYASYADSLQDHGKFFHENKRYADVIGLRDYRQQAQAIQAAGYATDPHYAEKLIQLIEENALAQWDQKVLTHCFRGTTSPSAYVVREGDNVAGIAKKYDVSVEKLVAANHLDNPNLIYPGQRLVIPVSGKKEEGQTYVVREGDTLSAIAQRFGISLQRIAADNAISNIHHIEPGQRIFITE